MVAPGHRVSLDSSLSIVKACLRGHKLTEPVRLAHEYVNSIKEALLQGLPKNKIADILEIKPQINADERRLVVRYYE